MSQTPTKDRRVEWLKTAMMRCPCADGLLCSHGQLILAILKDQGWQPIETAPKDRSEFIGWMPKGKRIAIMHWDDERYHTKQGGYFASYGFVFGIRALKSDQPTFWMPLPAPPVDATGVKP